MTAKTTAQNPNTINRIKNKEKMRHRMHTSENMTITYWNIPRTKQCKLEPSHQLQSCQTDENEQYLHELVERDHQYTKNTTGNKSCWFGFINGT